MSGEYKSWAKSNATHDVMLVKGARFKRRMEERRAAKAKRRAVEHDSRAVKFHF